MKYNKVYFNLYKDVKAKWQYKHCSLKKQDRFPMKQEAIPRNKTAKKNNIIIKKTNSDIYHCKTMLIDGSRLRLWK